VGVIIDDAISDILPHSLLITAHRVAVAAVGGDPDAKIAGLHLDDTLVETKRR
jgi:hypothetical protein